MKTATYIIHYDFVENKHYVVGLSSLGETVYQSCPFDTEAEAEKFLSIIK